MLETLAEYLNVEESDDVYDAASYVLSQNLVHGDALTMRTSDDQPITFAEWGYLGNRRRGERRSANGATQLQPRATPWVREPKYPPSPERAT